MTAIGSKEARTVCCRAQRREPANATGPRELKNDRDHKLSVKRQPALLGISRGSVCYLPREVPETDLALMRWVDELHLDDPFAGSRMLRDLLAGEGMHVGRLHVSALMKRMGIEALYRKLNTPKPEPGHKIYPYLLRKLAVTRPNQVRAIDITYVPMAEALYTSSPSPTGSVAGCLPGLFLSVQIDEKPDAVWSRHVYHQHAKEDVVFGEGPREEGLRGEKDEECAQKPAHDKAARLIDCD